MQSTPKYSALQLLFISMPFTLLAYVHHSQFMTRGLLLTNFGQFPNFSSYNSYITAPTTNQPTFPTSTTLSLFTYMLFSYTSYVFNSQFMTRGALLTISGHFRIPVFTTSPIQYQPSSNQFFQH